MGNARRAAGWVDAGMSYRVVIEPLMVEDGSGFVALVPDLPGCMSDGETRAEAAVAVEDAIEAWIEEAHRLDRDVPEPSAHVVAA